MELAVFVASAALVGFLAVQARRRGVAAVVAAALVSIAVSAAAGRPGFDSSVLFWRAMAFTTAELIVLGALAGWAVRTLPRARLAVALTALTAAVGAAGLWRAPLSDVTQWVLTTALLLGLTGCGVAGLLLRQSDIDRRRAALQARLDERLDLARELHDVVAHHVTGMVVEAQAAQLLGGRDPASVETKLAAIEATGADAMAAMRAMVSSLRNVERIDQEAPPAPGGVHPPPDEGADRARATPRAPAATYHDLELLAATSARLGLPVRLHLAAGLPDVLAPSVHRIVREALTNARRHAGDATLAEVTVAHTSDGIEVRIDDDGHSPSAPAGFGLIGMEERVTRLGGRLEVGHRNDGGWRVRAVLPQPNGGPIGSGHAIDRSFGLADEISAPPGEG